MIEKRILINNCNRNCHLCIWWECPILEQNKPALFHKKTAIIRDVKEDLDKKAILYYCPIHNRYFVNVVSLNEVEIAP